MNESVDLSLKNANPQRLAMRALEDRQILQQLLDGISPEARKIQIRENAFKEFLKNWEKRQNL